MLTLLAGHQAKVGKLLGHPVTLTDHQVSLRKPQKASWLVCSVASAV